MDSKLERIGEDCFAESGLEEFVAPPSLRQVEGGALWGCERLARVILNEGLEVLHERYTINGEFYGIFRDTGIEEIVLPKSLKVVDEYTFYDCEMLRKIYVEDGC